MNDDLLAGRLIIDLSQGVGAADCGRLLAGCSADVIKVERPAAGNPSRVPDPEEHLNAGKKGITLDYAQPSGAALLRRLVEGADALIEDSPPGSLEPLGLGYRELNAAPPPGIDLGRAPSPPLDPSELTHMMGAPSKTGRTPRPGEHNEEVYRGML